MSNLLSQASLVMIPSGYKEDVVYSQIPTNGNGDLSFTRASNGTRVNSAGLVEVAPWNLLEQSETFDNAGWTKAQISVSANTTTAPNGTTTADTITTSSTGVCYIYQAFSLNGGVFTLSIYAKKGNNNFIAINNQASATNWVTAVFDLTDGTFGEYAVGSGGGFTYISNNIESVGNGWYRCSLVFSGVTANPTYPSIMFAPSKTGNTFTSNYGETSGNASGKTLFIWGAQLNIGSTAKPYFPTTDRLNVPRLTYQNGGGGCPSLLLEKQSTNLMTYSEQFDNADWTKRNATISANNTTSPDGTQNADKLVEDTATGQHDFYQYFACINGNSYSMSFYAKASERTFCVASFSSSGLPVGDVFFNLQTGVVVSTPSGITATMTSVGNGWYRCVISATATSTEAAYFVYGNASNGSTKNYAGTSGSGTFIWGAQVEASSYPTSYIPTTSSSATRVIDDCRKTGISSLIGQSEGTLFIDLDLTAWDSNSFYFGIYGGGNEIYFRCNSTGEIAFVHYFGSTQALLSKSGLSLGRHKLAACYKNNDWAFYVDGILAGTDTSGSFSGTISQMVFGYTSISVYPPFQSVNQAVLFPTRLTNAELASLTTI